MIIKSSNASFDVTQRWWAGFWKQTP